MKIRLVFTNPNIHQGQSVLVNEHELEDMMRHYRRFGYRLSDYWYLDMTRSPRPTYQP